MAVHRPGPGWQGGRRQHSVNALVWTGHVAARFGTGKSFQSRPPCSSGRLRSLMKPEASVFFTKVIDYGLRFATSVLIARYLGPTDKGVLTFVMLVITWTVMFGNFSLTDASVYLVGKGVFTPDQAVGATALFSLLAGGAYTLLLLALLHSGLVHWAEGHPQVFYLLLVLIPIQLLVFNLTGVIQGLNRFKAYNSFTLIRSMLALIAVALAVWLAQSRLLGIAHAMIWSAVASAALLLVYTAKLVLWRPRISLKFSKEALRFGLRGHLSVVLAGITFRLDQFVLGASLNPDQLGWYSTAVSISELPQLLPDAIGVVLFPRVAGDHSGAASITARACRCTVLIMVITSAAIAVVAPVAIPFIFGRAYSPSVKPLFLLLPSIVFFSITKVLTKYMYGIGRPGWGVWSTAASAAVTLAMIFPLIHRYGMLGAAVTSSCAYAVGALLDLAITARLSGTRARDFLVFRKSDTRSLALTR